MVLLDKELSYSSSGVDVAAGEREVLEIGEKASATYNKAVLGGVGGFASLFHLANHKLTFDDPVLASATDGVGTKLLVANNANNHKSIGQDLVAMCANDLIVCGATPLIFLDYFATGSLCGAPLQEVVESIAAACKSIGCALVGGETAEMPGLYAKGHYDIAGFCVGVVDRKKIVNGESVRPGDIIIGLPSSGLHSNGFSLVRKIIFDRLALSANDTLFREGQHQVLVSEELLKPTRLYVNQILGLLSDGAPIKAMAHITGGGITGNVARTLPKGLAAEIDLSSWMRPKIFDILKTKGPLSENEMRVTFNLGLGFSMVVAETEAVALVKTLETLGENPFIAGKIVKSDVSVIFAGSTNV